jgi:hypothetical protein
MHDRKMKQQRDKKNSMIDSKIEDNRDGMNIVVDDDNNQRYVEPISKSVNRPGSLTGNNNFVA